MKPADVAQKVKAGRGWLVVRNSATLADTDYEHVADQIVEALNKRHAYHKLVEALKLAIKSGEIDGANAALASLNSTGRIALADAGEYDK